jgi:hypothetical protein
MNKYNIIKRLRNRDITTNIYNNTYNNYNGKNKSINHEFGSIILFFYFRVNECKYHNGLKHITLMLE